MSRTRKTPGKNGTSEDGQGEGDEEQSTSTTATSNGGSLNNFFNVRRCLRFLVFTV